MTTGEETTWRIEQFLAFNQVIFESHQFEASYHILAAAFHLARDAGNVELLEKIEGVARAQSDWIDLNMPEHPLSTRSKQQRAHGVLIYRGLGELAKAHAAMLRRNHK